MATRRAFLKTLGLGAAAAARPTRLTAKERNLGKPNIVFIMADDMGYGDVGCYNAESKIPTPHMDRLAREGVRFTDAHSPSAVCTPTRYGVLTGRYCWRSPLKRGVLYNYEHPLIPPERLTVASLLKQHGYATACIGKWHLGLGWSAKPGTRVDFRRPLPWPGGSPSAAFEAKIDFARPITGGPNALGFDYFFGTSGCSSAQPPYCFIENGRVIGTPSVRKGRAPGSRAGLKVPGWKHKDADPTFAKKAVEFIGKHQKESPGKPFFLYLAPSAPHEPAIWPVVPDFVKGKSKAGPRGDLVVLVDRMVGQVLDALDRHKLADHTLVIVTSDNGALPGHSARVDGRKPWDTYGHKSCGDWRGYKSHIWEGGHREPFIARWPGRIEPRTVCDEPIELTDLLATVAAILGAELPDDAGEDSYNILPALLGDPSAGLRAGKPIRKALIHHSVFGVFSIRQGRWKLIVGTESSGGWPPPRGTGPKPGAPGQLYDIAADPGETRNLWRERQDIVKRLAALLAKYKRGGRSAPRR